MSHTPIDPAALEEESGVVFPERLREFFRSSEWKKYEGFQVTNLPYFGSDVRSPITFANREDLDDKQEYAGSFTESKSTLWPLADLLELDGSFYLAADLSQDRVPVLFFDYESGFEPHSDSLEEFLNSLLPPGGKTQAELLSEIREKALALFEEEKYMEARDLVEQSLAASGSFRADILDSYRGLPGNLRNILALCYKNLGDPDRAMSLFEMAVEEGTKSAALNIISIYLSRKEWKVAAEYAEAKARSMYMLFDDYSSFYSFLYRGLAYLHLDEMVQATKFFGFIVTRFGAKEPKRVTEALEELRKIEGAGARERAEEIIAWLEPPVLVPDEATQKDLTTWWASIGNEQVRKKLGEVFDREPDAMQPEDLAALIRATELKLDHLDVEDVSFLTRFTRLRELSLEGNMLEDLGPLAELKRLVELKLDGNPINDLSPLRDLVRLEKLDLGDCGLTDVSALAGLKNLRKLRLNGNKLQSVEPLSDLPALVELSLYNNELTDLNCLKNNRLLKEISCFGNPLEKTSIRAALELRSLPLLQDLDAHWRDEAVTPEGVQLWQESRPFTVALTGDEVKHWRAWWESLPEVWREALADEVDELTEEDEDGNIPGAEGFFELRKENHLSLGQKELSDITPLTRLERLDYVSVSENGIAELPDLSTLRCLRSLNLHRNPLKNLEPLGDLPVIAYLGLDECRLADLSGLPDLPTLRQLDLSRNGIGDVSPLARFTGLRRLELIGNEIEDIAPLGKLTEIRQLFLQENQAKDVSALANCSNLEELVIFSNPGLTGLLSLVDLPYLYLVRAHGSFSGAEIRAFRKVRPDVDVL